MSVFTNNLSEFMNYLQQVPEHEIFVQEMETEG